MSGGGPGEADWLRAMLAFPASPPPEPDPVEPGVVDELAAALRLGLALRGRTAPAALLPAGLDLGLRRAVLEAVLPDADVAPGQEGWLLRDAPRRAALAGLGPDQVRALAADLAPQDETAQALLMLQDEPPALDTLSTEAIGAAVRTLDMVGPGLSAWTAQQAQGAAQALRRRHRREDYGQLADGFVGRRWDLRLLHGFLTQPLAAQAEWAQPAVAALVLGGPGGTGKSALLARVLGELLDADSGLPLVHLDFDRPALDPLIPGSLDSELLRQLCLLGGEVEAFLTPLAALVRSASGGGSPHAGPSQEAADSRAAASMEDSLGWLRGAGRPLLVVLDTTEQVQAGGSSRVEALLQWIGRLGAGSGAPEVRVVLAGRGDPEAWSMQGSAGRTVLAGGGGAGPRDRARLRQIPDLGPSEAARLLESRGVTAAQAPALARRFGGNPLVLRLVADLVRDGDALDMAEGALPQGLVQGYLYDRILKHLDEPARSFAHPGVVLPEITLPMIGGILAPAKQRTLAPGEDVAVFEGLARPAWLMRREGDTLRLRPDLRRLTRQLIASDPAHAAETRAVHVRASEWHAAQDGPEHAALALYHRLMLGEMAVPATLPPAAGPVLIPLLDDLMESVRTAVQARMGQTVGAEAALEALSDKDWSAYLDDEGGEGDKLSNVRASDALAIWRSRPTGDSGEPPTFVLQALAETGEWDSAEVDVLRVAVALTGSAASGDRAPPGERLYWAVCLNLMRPPHVLHTRLVPVLRAALAAPRQRQWRPDDLLRLAALAELLTPGLDVLPQRRRVADEPRTPRVVLALARGGDQSRNVTADTMVVMQTDWLQRLGANVPGVYWHTGSAQRAQDVIDRIDGGQLAAVPERLRLLESVNVAIGPCGRGDDRRLAPWLRDTTPELHRPARDALRAALPTEDQADPVLAQWRRRLTVVPTELSAPALLYRLARDPAGYWLQVVRFADSTRTLGALLGAARRAAPDAARLANVAETFDAWDVALGLGWRSEWTAYGEPYGRNEESAPMTEPAYTDVLARLAQAVAADGPHAERTEQDGFMLEGVGAGALSGTPISQAAIDLLIAAEVSSPAVYTAKYTHPVWPGGDSGVTIGIGYDVGTVTQTALAQDWLAELGQEAIQSLGTACGIMGPQAAPVVGRLSTITIPFDQANRVFLRRSVPEFIGDTERALPNTNLIGPDCLGALVSLTYNRGAAYGRPEDRFREMRAIHDHMADRQFALIPAEFRSMKRIWAGKSGLEGVVLRREAEAQLFERGLANLPAAPAAPVASIPRAEGFVGVATAVSDAFSTVGGWLRPVVEEATRDRLMFRLAGGADDLITADEDYVAVRVLSGRIVNARRWTSLYHGAVHATCNMLYEGIGSDRSERQSVLAPDGFRDIDPKGQGKLLQVDRPLFGPMPYRGDLRMSIALFSVKSSDLAAPYLSLISELSQTASLGFLAAAQPFIAPLSKAADLLFGTSDAASLECGTVRGFEPLRAGTWVCLGATRQDIPDTSGFRVDPEDFRLLDGAGRPVQAFPYLVFQILKLAQRDNWMEIPGLKAAWDAISTTLNGDKPQDAPAAAKTFRRMCFAGGDLTLRDAARLAEKADRKVALTLGTAASMRPEGVAGTLRSLDLYGK